MKNSVKNNVMISLVSTQWQDGEKTETELLTKAEYHRIRDSLTISYEDTSATGFEGCVTTLKVDKNLTASIIRSGTVTSALNLEMGKKYYCQYGTPYGDFRIGVYTHSIKNELENGGNLYMKYTLDINSSHLSDNEIILKIENNNIKEG